MQRVIVALALSAGATRALQFAAPVARLHSTIARAEADAPVTSADMDEAAEAAAPAVEAEAAVSSEAIDTEAGAPAPAADKPKKKDKADATPLADLVVGNSYDGTITGVAAYGAFVDIGAQSDGLVHISELSTEFVSDVNAVVKEGEAVSVRVLKVDEAKKQLSLSLKPEGAAAAPKRNGGGRKKKAGAEELKQYLEADPQVFVEGTVRTVLSWGAFVNIAEGVDGLVHISRYSDERTEDLEAELSAGDKVQVRIVEVDLEKATLALAMNTYREGGPAPRRARDDGDGESAAARRARDPDAKFGGQRKPKRRDPGDDMWDNTDSFAWKDVVLEDPGDANDLAAGFTVDEKGQLSLM